MSQKFCNISLACGTIWLVYMLYRGRKDDEPHWTVRYQARLILSKCYSQDLPRSWKWWATLDYEILSPPDTLQLLLTGFTEVGKGLSHTGLWDTKPSWYSPIAIDRIYRGRERNEPYWTVRYRALLILSNCNLLDLLRSWKWLTTLLYQKRNCIAKG